MEHLSITQDDYLRRLEQTLNLLKRAKAEQQLADLAERAKDLAEREEQLAREAETADASKSESLAAEQEQLQEELEQLRKDLEQAIEEMGELDPAAAGEMAEAAAEMEACELSEKMEQARSKLSESKPSEASEMCQSASNDLLALFTRLSSCQGGMACSVQNRDRAATLRAIDELLGVSAEQEEIVEAVDGRSRIPRPELVELVAKEADLVEAMSAIADRMFQVSKDSYVIDPSIYRSFGAVQMAMTRAASHIADGGASAGHKEARAALGSVNSLVVHLLTSNQSSSGMSGGAMNQLMQQLRQMGEQQSRLNEMTEALRQQMEQLGMSMGAERQLAEMRGMQESILEEARRLAEEFGDRREILGRLDDTVEEMEGTLEEMERSGASQETVDRQKRILSRLLDAQRSLRKRDYTRERTSQTGERYARTVPGELPRDIERARQELREDLLRAMQRGYPSEYRELIRAYFRGLTSDVTGLDAEGGDAAGEGAP
jgi:chromosome segregation ATPase